MAADDDFRAAVRAYVLSAVRRFNIFHNVPPFPAAGRVSGRADILRGIPAVDKTCLSVRHAAGDFIPGRQQYTLKGGARDAHPSVVYRVIPVI